MRIWIVFLLAAAGLSQETFHITGTVINGKTGQPVKGALVTVRGRVRSENDHRPIVEQPRELRTDAAGHFTADRLPPGSFSLTAEKSGFTADRSPTYANSAPAASRNRLTLSLSPLAVIAGRVTNSDGDPVPFAVVRVVTCDLRDGRRANRLVNGATTDDQGRYRIGNVEPGEYYITTAGRTPTPSAGNPAAFAPVWYPAALDATSATPISLSAGQQFTADLRVRMEPSFRIRGKLLGTAVSPPPVMLLLRGAGDQNPASVDVNSATGEFEVADVVPGTYLLRGMQHAPDKPLLTEQQVQVRNTDVTGLELALSPGMKVSGVVRMPAPPVAASAFRPRGPGLVCLMPVDDRFGNDGFGTGFSCRTPDQYGAFSFGAAPIGRYRLKLDRFYGYATSAVSGTQDLLRGELVVGAGVTPPPIEIDIRQDFGTLSVSTTGEDGEILANPLDGREVQRLRTGKTSAFPFPPGRYQLLWVKDADKLEFRNPTVLRALRGGVTVEVTARSTTTVALKEMAQ